MLFYQLVAVAQETVPVVVQAPPSFLVKLQEILANDLGWVITLGAIVLELGMRVFKTTKPQSILYYIANVLKISGEVFIKLAETIDKVLQRVKEPKL